VGSRHDDQLPWWTVGHQFLGDCLHLFVGAQAGDDDVGLTSQLGQSRRRLRARASGCAQSNWIEVVGDDVETARKNVPAHRKSHVANTDDSDHVPRLSHSRVGTKSPQSLATKT
jgi:hypothetical protein